MKFTSIIFKTPNPYITENTSITKFHRLMLLRDVTAVCIQHRMKSITHGTVREKGVC